MVCTQEGDGDEEEETEEEEEEEEVQEEEHDDGSLAFDEVVFTDVVLDTLDRGGFQHFRITKQAVALLQAISEARTEQMFEGASGAWRARDVCEDDWL